MFDRVKLRRDLTDCGGHVLARAGTVISVESIAEAVPAQAAPGMPRSPTPSSPTTWPTLREDATLGHLFRADEVRSAVRRVVEAATVAPSPRRGAGGRQARTRSATATRSRARW